MTQYDLPRMLYHVIQEPVIVHSQKELEEFLEKGWSTTPVLFDEIKALKAKIAYHESEVKRLEEILEGIDLPEEEKREENRVCAKCGYIAKSNAGLAAHQKKHKYEQEPENETVLENSSK